MIQRLTFFFLMIFFFIVSCRNGDAPSENNKHIQVKEITPSNYRVGNTKNTILKILNDAKSIGLKSNIYGLEVLTTFYQNRDYQAAWTKINNIESALSSIKDLYKDGLDPEDYHYSLLKKLSVDFTKSKIIDSINFAKFDVFMTDAIITAAGHLISGKVNPESLKRQWEVKTESYKKVFKNPSKVLQSALDNEKIPEILNSLKPSHYMYTGLKNALAEYRGYKEKGNWDSIASGKTIKLGDKSERVLDVRSRLLASHEMQNYSAVNDTVYDSILKVNMKVFQKKYGIEVDGNIGKQTLYELNIPLDYRIEQIKANMERARWVLYQIEKKFIAVNIAGFELYFVEDEKEILTSRVIVGKSHTMSPIFKGIMQYVVINPTWTVPRSLYPGYIKKLQNNPEYFAQKNMEVITSSGEYVPITGKDWSEYTIHNFPYMIRQKAGPNNALGYIKCMFPNKHSVYIHDTPARSLFSKDKRAFSHGCIRTQKIRDVALLLLEPNKEGWTTEKIDQIIESRKTTTIRLKEKVPILILYWTAGIGFNKNFYFKPDVYNRDRVLIDALNNKTNY